MRLYHLFTCYRYTISTSLLYCLQLSSNDTVSWEFITRQSERLSERINDWATSPPKFEIPAHWTNETMWIDLLTKYSESMNSQSQITERLVEIFTTL